MREEEVVVELFSGTGSALGFATLGAKKFAVALEIC